MPEAVDPRDERMIADGAIPNRRKRNKPERFNAGPASGKRCLHGTRIDSGPGCTAKESDTRNTTQSTKLTVVKSEDMNEELIRLKQRYIELYGTKPRGKYCNQKNWLQLKIAKLEGSAGVVPPQGALFESANIDDMRHNEEAQPASAVTRTEAGLQNELGLQELQPTLASPPYSTRNPGVVQPTLVQPALGPHAVQAGDRILYKFLLDSYADQSAEKEQWFYGTVSKTRKEKVRVFRRVDTPMDN